MKAPQRLYLTPDEEVVPAGHRHATTLLCAVGADVPPVYIDAVEALDLKPGTVDPAEEEAEATPDEAPEESAAPSNRATVAVWQEYAESLGIDPAGLTKAQLIDAVEAQG